MFPRSRIFAVVVVLSLVGCVTRTESEANSSDEALRPEGENPDVESAAAIEHAREVIQHEFANAKLPTRAAIDDVHARYAHLDPAHVVPTDLLDTAVAYFDANKDSFPNQGYLTVVDFKPRSDRYRFFLVNMQDGSVEKYHTTHGSGSDTDADGYAEAFGNVPGSNMSSLGFVRTAEVYVGTYKRSIRLDGLSDTNSNIRARAVVFHGWDKTREENVIQARSAGCITLDYAVKDAVLDKIKEGSLMYVGVSTGS